MRARDRSRAGATRARLRARARRRDAGSCRHRRRRRARRRRGRPRGSTAGRSARPTSAAVRPVPGAVTAPAHLPVGDVHRDEAGAGREHRVRAVRGEVAVARGPERAHAPTGGERCRRRRCPSASTTPSESCTGGANGALSWRDDPPSRRWPATATAPAPSAVRSAASSGHPIRGARTRRRRRAGVRSAKAASMRRRPRSPASTSPGASNARICADSSCSPAFTRPPSPRARRARAAAAS